MKKMMVFKMGLGFLLTVASAFGSDRLILDMVHHNPGDKLYDSAYVDPVVIKEMGYNGKVYFLFESPALAINWESVDPDILPKGSEERKWVDAKAEQIRKMHAACKAQDIKTYAMSDLILFPKRLIAKYGIEKTFGDPQNPQIEKLLRAQINEMFDQFPDFDGLVVRIGETYLQDAPYHQGHIKNKSDPQKTIIPLMQLLRDEICVKRNKQLIFRTWRAFDNNEKRYQAVSDGVEPHPNLVISIKHCEGDFFRTNPYSRCIGMGRHRQIIEVQCAREYEGKGAYPNYVANGVIEGFEEHAAMAAEGRINSLRSFYEKTPKLFAGIWTWSRGGGWEGPYIKDEMWCDLNAWVTAQWALDPSKSEESIFNRYAAERLKLKGEDIAKFRRLCLLSANSVLKGRYSERGGMKVSWTRDQGISWPKINKNADMHKRDLQHKDEAISQWKEIVTLTETIQWADEQTREHAIGSAYYGLRLYEIYRSIIYLADADARADQADIAQWIKTYDTAWAVYNQLPDQYPVIASLYTQDYVRHIKNPADKNVNRLRAAVAEPAAIGTSGDVLFKLGTADGNAANKKTFTPSIVSVAGDERVKGPVDGTAWKAGSTLTILANSEWAGFSMAALNGTTIDSPSEFETGYVEFTIRAVPGSVLNCRELRFSSARGGKSKARGYALYASVNGAGFDIGDAPVSSVANETGTRTAPRSVSVDLSASSFQGIGSITFRYYPLTQTPGYTMDFDGMALYGLVEKVR